MQTSTDVCSNSERPEGLVPFHLTCGFKVFIMFPAQSGEGLKELLAV